MTPALALVLAWVWDRRFGEPRNAWHPVAWFGRACTPLGVRLTALRPAVALGAGALAWGAAVGTAAAMGWALECTVMTLPMWLALPLTAAALKPTFAWRLLYDEVRSVEASLAEDLTAGRSRLSRLCSRDVHGLDETGVRETAIETLAENLNDSLVAPLFWFVVGGLPAAWAFRAANTLDAMWGYRGRWEWAGKCAARADDLLCWVPARVTAALLWRPAVPLRVLAREARATPSPNGGWPMAAMALRLGVRLGKPAVYTLHATGRAAGPAAVRQALHAAQQAARAAVLLTALALLIRHPAWAGA